MSTKKDNKKDKDKSSSSRKRDKPEQKEWDWDDTVLEDAKNTSMLAQDVKQLLITRGEKKQNLKGKKIEMIEYLKEKYTVQLNEPIEDLTCKEIIVELRLRKLNDTPSKKDILVQRLKGEIDAAPPKKKARKGRKPKNTVYVTVYTPPALAEDNNVTVLGVFKSESKAYDKGMDQLIDDMEDKYGDKQKKIESATEKIGKIDKKHYRKKMEAVNDAVIKAFGGKEDDAPYVEIMENTLTI